MSRYKFHDLAGTSSKNPKDWLRASSVLVGEVPSSETKRLAMRFLKELETSHALRQPR